MTRSTTASSRAVLSESDGDGRCRATAPLSGGPRRWRALRLVVPAVVVAALAGPLALTGGVAYATPATSTIAVGSEPRAVAVDPGGDVYVTNFSSGSDTGTVSVIDPATNRVISTIAVGSEPGGVAVGPGGDVYVANYGSGTVSVIDPTTNRVISTIAVGSEPGGVAVDLGGDVYVTNIGSGTVSVIDPTTNRVISTIAVGSEPYGVAVDPGGDVYVTNFGSDTVSVIDPSINTVVGSPIAVGSEPAGVAVGPGGDVYVANSSSASDTGTVSVINPTTNTVISTITVGSEPGGVAVDPGGDVYVTNNVSDTVSVIDPTTNTVVGSPIAVGSEPIAVAVDPGGDVYVTNFGSDTVSVITPATPAPTVGPASQVAFVDGTPPSSVTSGQQFAVQAAVEDAGGSVESGDSVDEVTLVGSPGVVSCSSSTTQRVTDGVATWSCSLMSAGSEHLSVTSGTLSEAEATVAVSPGPVSQLAFSPVANQTAGKAFAVAVSVEDAAGNVEASDDTSEVSLSGGGVECSANTVTVVSGVASFTGCALDTPGSFQLSADATVGSTVLTAKSNAVVVSAGAASTLRFVSAPSSVVAGTPFAVKVEALDSVGNPVSGYQVGLSATASGSKADVLLGSTSQTTGSGGIATFSGLTIDRSGSIILTADGPIATTSVMVTPAAASQLAFTAAATSGGLGVALSTTTVQVEDQFGNHVDDPGLGVSLSSSPSGLQAAPVLAATDASGTATFTSLAFDHAGVFTLDASATMLANAVSPPVSVGKATPKVIVVGSPDPTTAGVVTYTVTVSGPTGAAIPTGTVSVSDGAGGSCGPVDLSGGQAQCTIAEGAQAGSYTITASYSGDGNYIAASGTGSESVHQAASITALTMVSSTSTTYGAEQTEQFAVRVTPADGGPTPTGSVTIFDSTTDLGVCTVTLAQGTGDSATGVCSAPADAMAGGSNVINARYIGNADYSSSSSSSTTIEVAKASTTTTIVPSANPAATGPVTYTVTVSGPGVQPAGTVTLSDATGSCSDLTLVAGSVATATAPGTATAVCTLDAMASASPSTVTAKYSGDGNDKASTGQMVETVAKATPAVTVTPSASPGVTGAVTYAVTVSGPTGAVVATTPAGSVVTVSDGHTSCTTTLTDGSGSCTLDQQAALSPYTVTASYGGDANYGAATGSVSEVVKKAKTSTSLGLSPSTVAYGQENTVSFDVTVTGAPVGPAPGGQVDIFQSFEVGITAPVCIVTLSGGSGGAGSGGVASGMCTMSGAQLAVAKNLPFVAQYQGDSNYKMSDTTANPLPLTINRATPAVTVTANANPAQAGTVTYTVTVTGVSGSVIPTGTVSVQDGDGHGCSSEGLTDGQAACSIIEPAGSYTVTATYTPAAGSPYASTVGSLNETVGKASPTVMLAGPGTTTFGSETGSGYGVTVSGLSAMPAPTGTVTVEATSGSGVTVDLCTVDLGAGSCAFTSPTALTPGSYQVTGVYHGDTNYMSVTSNTFVLTVVQATPGVSVVGPATAVQAGSVAYTVTVSGAAGIAPTGSVTIRDGAGSRCVVTLDSGDGGVGSCRIVEAADGTKAAIYDVTATYAGNLDYASATSGTLRQVVHPDTYQTTLRLAAASVGYGAENTVTATVLVTPTSTTGTSPSGIVTVTTTVSGGTVVTLCTATITDGFGTCPLSSAAAESLAPDTYPVTATFLGAGVSQASTPTTLVVTIATPTVTVSGSPDPATLSAAGTVSVNYLVAVSGVSPGAATPTGSVVVSDNASPSAGTCTVTLKDGTGGCSITENKAMTYTVDGSYTPDTSSAVLYTSATATTSETVLAAGTPGSTGGGGGVPTVTVLGVSATPTTTTLSLSNAAVTVGSENNESFGVSVTSTSGVPTGTATVEADGAALCTVILTNGAGTCSPIPAALSAGSYTITAAYPATGSFAASTSAGQLLAVNPAPSTAAGGSGSTSPVTKAAGSGAAQPTATDGYWLVGANGAVFAYGDASYAGGGNTLAGGVGNAVVAMAIDPSGGYWLVTDTGAVYAFGGADYLGGANTLNGGAGPGTPIVGMAATSTGGYILVGADGAVYAYSADYLGGVNTLNGGRGPGTTIVGVATTANGGYLLVGQNGAVYAFGTAYDGGANTGVGAGTPIVGIAANAAGGYWLVGQNGIVLGYGTGALGGPSSIPGGPGSLVTGIVATTDGGGYWVIARNGAVFAYGNAQYSGGTNTIPGGTGTTIVGGTH